MPIMFMVFSVSNKQTFDWVYSIVKNKLAFFQFFPSFLSFSTCAINRVIHTQYIYIKVLHTTKLVAPLKYSFIYQKPGCSIRCNAVPNTSHRSGVSYPCGTPPKNGTILHAQQKGARTVRLSNHRLRLEIHQQKSRRNDADHRDNLQKLSKSIEILVGTEIHFGSGRL